MLKRPALLFAAALCGAVSIAPRFAAAETIKMTVATGHPPVFLWVKLLDEQFIPEVDKRLAASGRHKIEWTKAYGGTLAKLGSESLAVRDGIADLAFISTIFEAARFPLQNVSYFAPFGSSDLFLVTKVTSELLNSIPAMREAWTKSNLVYLGGASLETYQVWSNFPIKSVDDLKGKKFSMAGPSANWIKNTGAVPVAGTLNTYYEDIKSGVSDGAFTFASGAASAKLVEVAPYITRANIGAMYAGGLAINKKRFDKMPPEVQQVIREAGANYAASFAKAQSELASKQMEAMVRAGAKVYELPESERKRWVELLPPIGKTWAAEMQAQGLPGGEVLRGYMEGLKQGGAQVPRDWAN
ncbi:MAG: C4-dicarboxylate TRAP transporter substrate-binding protein [Zoogloeaceae bacterium]|nr:C4-dicarboxylate TRAP transporter substrate-binding protein [Zoogloeaceae bacterium]